MPKLIIDDIEVEVPVGTSVLEAARSVGITIPHFCYHPALAIAAACRLCAVKMLDGPVKGIQMSCALPAQDGMVVSTTDPDAVKMRKLVIEWLMINHPHDCPVCDEGGECLLQDFTIAGGHGIRRYQGKKRTHVNQFLGDGIYHEMNRCIQCYRCVRFYQEYAGGTDFGVTGSAGRVYFGRFEEGALESPFSGNLVDICPTGVFTDKTGRFRARYWDYQYAPSICPHCSAGCNLSPQAYHREVIKIVARRNDEVNGWFICDRARFDKSDLNDPLRPRQALLDGNQVEWETALAALVTRLQDFVQAHGADSLALVGSTRLSLEAGILLAELASRYKGARLCYFIDQTDAQRSLAKVEWVPAGMAASQAELREADCIAVLPCDLMEESPMIALAIRQAFVKGAKVYLVAPDLTALNLGRLPFQAQVVPELKDVPFGEAKRGIVVTGAAFTELKELEAPPAGVKFVLLQPGPNSFGAALLAREYRAVSLQEAVASGKVKGILALETDLPEELRQGVTFLAAADWRNNGLAEHASVFLPTSAWAETGGTWVNYEGRAQRYRQAYKTGLPLRGLQARYYGSQEAEPPAHPPRVHRAVPPGGDNRSAWMLVAELIVKLTGEPATEPYAGKWAPLKHVDPEGPGLRLPAELLKGGQ